MSFIKIGDIKGEFAAPRSKAIGSWTLQDNTFRHAGQLSSHAPASKTGEAGLDPGPIGAGSDRFTTGGGGDSLTSWRDVRDHNHGKFTDALTNAGPEGYTEVEWTYLTGGGQSDLSVLRDGDWNDLAPQPEADGADALVQQGNDFAGLISPDQMRPVDLDHAKQLLAPGRAVEWLVSNSDQMFSPISGEGVFAQRDGLGATSSVIVGDNHF